MSVEIGITKQRGEFEETVIHDTTRLTNPVTARVLRRGDEFLVIPENDNFPVLVRDNFNAAVNAIEQMIPDETKGAFG